MRCRNGFFIPKGIVQTMTVVYCSRLCKRFIINYLTVVYIRFMVVLFEPINKMAYKFLLNSRLYSTLIRKPMYSQTSLLKLTLTKGLSAVNQTNITP